LPATFSTNFSIADLTLRTRLGHIHCAGIPAGLESVNSHASRSGDSSGTLPNPRAEHGLNAAINKLRQTLGDSTEKPRFIETLPGQGYRFVAAVRVEAPGLACDPTPLAVQATPPPPKMQRWPLLLACAGVSLGFLAAGLLLARREPPAYPPLPAKLAIFAQRPKMFISP